MKYASFHFFSQDDSPGEVTWNKSQCLKRGCLYYRPTMSNTWLAIKQRASRSAEASIPRTERPRVRLARSRSGWPAGTWARTGRGSHRCRWTTALPRRRRCSSGSWAANRQIFRYGRLYNRAVEGLEPWASMSAPPAIYGRCRDVGTQEGLTSRRGVAQCEWVEDGFTSRFSVSATINVKFSHIALLTEPW